MRTPIGSIHRVIIRASDTRKCAAFFRDHFGYTPLGEWTEQWAELDAGGCKLAFHQGIYDPNPVGKSGGSPADPHKIVIVVRDVQEACDRLKARGVKMGAIKSFPERDGLVLCQGADPEGHIFQLSNR
jgi:catechol 2,3-dioxygenase-like lactoylglutathione lyase family enzyme